MYHKTFAFVLLAAVVLAGCSDDGTTGPQEAGYNIYIGAWWANRPDSLRPTMFFYVYDAGDLSLRDSIPLPVFPMDMAVSPNGRSLYVRSDWVDRKPGFVYKVDVATKEVVWTQPVTYWEGTVAQLKGGRLLLAGHDVLSTENGRVVGHVPDSLVPGWGPEGGTLVAAAAVDTAADGHTPFSVVAVLDVETGETHGRYVPHLRSGRRVQANNFRLHPDGRRVLVMGQYSAYQTAFLIGDVQTGETLLENPGMFAPLGEIAISPDGKTAVVTDPGVPMFGDSQPYVDIYDLEAPARVKTLFFGGPQYHESQITFLPGGRRVLFAPLAYFNDSPFRIFSLNTMDTDTLITMPGARMGAAPGLGAIGVGPRP